MLLVFEPLFFCIVEYKTHAQIIRSDYRWVGLSSLTTSTNKFDIKWRENDQMNDREDEQRVLRVSIALELRAVCCVVVRRSENSRHHE